MCYLYLYRKICTISFNFANSIVDFFLLCLMTIVWLLRISCNCTLEMFVSVYLRRFLFTRCIPHWIGCKGNLVLRRPVPHARLSIVLDIAYVFCYRSEEIRMEIEILSITYVFLSACYLFYSNLNEELEKIWCCHCSPLFTPCLEHWLLDRQLNWFNVSLVTIDVFEYDNNIHFK